MKAEELMIGDWVKIKTYGVSDQFERTEAYIYVKIAEIGSGLITVDYNNDIKEPYRIYENTEIEPIPLTPEILEKNGFDPNGIPEEYLPIEERDYSDDTYVWSIGSNIDDTRYQVCVYIDYPKDICWFEAFTPDSHIDGIRIKYIHQLQHALKLCNINKEIML